MTHTPGGEACKKGVGGKREPGANNARKHCQPNCDEVYMSNNQQAHRLLRGGQILGAPVHCTLIAQQVVQECDDQLLDEAVKAGSSGLSDTQNKPCLAVSQDAETDASIGLWMDIPWCAQLSSAAWSYDHCVGCVQLACRQHVPLGHSHATLASFPRAAQVPTESSL